MTAHEMLVERLVQAGRNAGRAQLANLAYEMARSASGAVESLLPGRFRWIEMPRNVIDLRSSMERLKSRSGQRLPMDSLPLVTPTTSEAAKAGLECLRVASEIEGDSPRVQFLRAKFIRSEGDVEEATSILRHVLRHPLELEQYLVISESLQSHLIQSGHHESAIRTGRQLLKLQAARPTAAFNSLTSTAWLESSESFDQLASQFSSGLNEAHDRTFWVSTVKSEAGWLATQLSLDPEYVVKHLGCADALPPTPGERQDD